MDAFTAELLLAAAERCEGDPGQQAMVADLYKALNKDSGGPTAEALLFFEKHEGKRCAVRFTCYTGILTGLNTATSGFYPGSRYPFYVKITESTDEKFSDAIGSSFQYGLDQIEILE